MTDHPQLRIQVTGDFRHSGFRNEFCNPDCSFRFTEWSQLENLLDLEFDFLIVAQSRRGQFSQARIDWLVQQFPLHSKALLMGAWCEGETRSGLPLAGLHRIHLRNWPVALERIVCQLQATGTSEINRPPTETRADVLMAKCDDVENFGALNVAVHAVDTQLYGAISEFCEIRRWSACRLANTKKWDVAIIECWYSVEEVVAVLAEYPSVREKPVVVVCGFPRPQDRERLAELFSNSLLLGKPFENELLESAVKLLVVGNRLKIVGDVA